MRTGTADSGSGARGAGKVVNFRPGRSRPHFGTGCVWHAASSRPGMVPMYRGGGYYVVQFGAGGPFEEIHESELEPITEDEFWEIRK